MSADITDQTFQDYMRHWRKAPPGITTTELRTYQPDEAAEVMRHFAFNGQRPLRRNKVRFYAQEMREGRFALSTIVFASADGEQWFLIDGQHRLSAVVEVDTPIEFNVLWKKVEDVAVEYSRTDRGMARSAADAAGIDALAQESGLNGNEARLVFAALPYLMMNFDPRTNSNEKAALVAPENRREIFRTWAPFARAFFQAISKCELFVRNKITNGPTLAVALVTLRYDKSGGRAMEFWRRVSHREGRRGQPEDTLWVFLARSTVVQVGKEEFARSVALCWNAYYEGRGLTAIKLGSTNTKYIKIAGTPYRGDVAVHSVPIAP